MSSAPERRTFADTLVTDDPVRAAEFLRAGEPVAFPTETVYGLGADARSPESVARIYATKGRPADNPLIVHVADIEALSGVASELPDTARRLLDRFAPGPLTVVVPRHPELPDAVSAGLPTVGVRIPSHPVALAFLRACDCPVAAPSANRSGRPSPTRAEDVLADLDGRVRCVLRGGASEVGLESTVVDCTTEPPLLLRKGGIGLEALQEVLPNIRVAKTRSEALSRSPGTRYRHYCPRAQVELTGDPARKGNSTTAWIGLEAPEEPESYGKVRVCADLDDYGRTLFAFFRDCDDAGMSRIRCLVVDEEGLGAAIMDRVRRAAAG